METKLMPLAAYLQKHRLRKLEAEEAIERVHRAMSPDPWLAPAAQVNVSFIQTAICEALDRTGISLAVASRSQLFSALPAWLGSPAKIFDEIISLQIDLNTLQGAVQEKHLKGRKKKCPCCGEIDDWIADLLKNAYALTPSAGAIAIDNRLSVMVCYLTLLALGDQAAAGKMERLVAAHERAAIIGELPKQPGLFLVQVR